MQAVRQVQDAKQESDTARACKQNKKQCTGSAQSVAMLESVAARRESRCCAGCPAAHTMLVAKRARASVRTRAHPCASVCKRRRAPCRVGTCGSVKATAVVTIAAASACGGGSEQGSVGGSEQGSVSFACVCSNVLLSRGAVVAHQGMYMCASQFCTEFTGGRFVREIWCL